MAESDSDSVSSNKETIELKDTAEVLSIEKKETTNNELEAKVEELIEQMNEEEQDKSNTITNNNSTSKLLASSSSILKRTTLISPLPLRIERHKETNKLTLTSPRQKYHENLSTKKNHNDDSSLTSRVSTKLPRVALLAQQQQQQINKPKEELQSKKSSKNNVHRRKTISAISRIKTKLEPKNDDEQSISSTIIHPFSSSVNAPTASSTSRYNSHPYAKVDWDDETSILDKFPLLKDRGVLPVPKGLIDSRNTFLEKAKSVREWRKLEHVEQLRLVQQWSEYEDNKKGSTSPTIKTSKIIPKKLNFSTTTIDNTIVSNATSSLITQENNIIIENDNAITNDNEISTTTSVEEQQHDHNLDHHQPASQSTKEQMKKGAIEVILQDKLEEISIIEKQDDDDDTDDLKEVVECAIDKELQLLAEINNGMDMNVEIHNDNDDDLLVDDDVQASIGQYNNEVKYFGKEEQQSLEEHNESKGINEELMDDKVEASMTIDEVKFMQSHAKLTEFIDEQQQKYLDEVEFTHSCAKLREFIEGQEQKYLLAAEERKIIGIDEAVEEEVDQKKCDHAENDENAGTPSEEIDNVEQAKESLSNDVVIESTITSAVVNEEEESKSYEEPKSIEHMDQNTAIEPSKVEDDTNDASTNPNNSPIKKVTLKEQNEITFYEDIAVDQPSSFSLHESAQAVADSTQASSTMLIEEDSVLRAEQELVAVIDNVIDVIENDKEALDIPQGEDPLLNTVIKVVEMKDDDEDVVLQDKISLNNSTMQDDKQGTNNANATMNIENNLVQEDDNNNNDDSAQQQLIITTNVASSDSNESFECVIEQSNDNNVHANNNSKNSLKDDDDENSNNNPIIEEELGDIGINQEDMLNNDDYDDLSLKENEETIDKYDEAYEERNRSYTVDESFVTYVSGDSI